MSGSVTPASATSTTGTDGTSTSSPDSSSAQAAEQSMQDAFNYAIEQTSKVTVMTTEYKADLDAAQQRPQSA
jgi:hypothetical protein